MCVFEEATEATLHDLPSRPSSGVSVGVLLLIPWASQSRHPQSAHALASVGVVLALVTSTLLLYGRQGLMSVEQYAGETKAHARTDMCIVYHYVQKPCLELQYVCSRDFAKNEEIIMEINSPRPLE